MRNPLVKFRKHLLFMFLAAILSLFLSCSSSDRVLNLDGSGWSYSIGDEGALISLDSSSFRNLSELLPDKEGFLEVRTEFFYSPEDPGDLVSLYLGRIIGVDEVFVNGILIGKTGSLPPHWNNEWNIDRLYSFPSSLLKEGKSNTLSIRLYLRNEGLLEGPLMIGPTEELQKKERINSFFHSDLNALLAFSFLFLSLYNIFFFLKRREDREFFWFAAVSVSFSLNHSSLFVTSIPGFSYELFSSLSSIKFYAVIEMVLGFSMIKFIESFIHGESEKKLRKLIYLPSLAALFILLLQEGYGQVKFLQGVFEASLILLGAYVLVIFMMGRDSRKLPVKTVLLAIGPAILSVLHDVTLPYLIDGYSIYLAGIGFAVFLVTINLLLTQDFVNDRNNLEILNKNLEEKIRRRSKELLLANEKIAMLTRKEDFIDSFNLSKREREVLSLILDGQTNDEIADNLGVSIRTINAHLYNLYRKLGVHSRVEIFSRFQE